MGAYANLCELHVHLDGSIPPKTFFELNREMFQRLSQDALDAREQAHAQKLGEQPQFASVQEAAAFMKAEVGHLHEVLEKMKHVLFVMQTPSAIERVAYDLCCEMVGHGVTYAEVRHCPSLHRALGMPGEAVVEAVERGLSRAMERFPGTEFNQIITALRDLGPADALAMVRLAVEHAHRGVVGVDLAGHEAAHPPELFVEAFDLAHKHGMHITIHAGEIVDKAKGAANVRAAVDKLHATRIGHGWAAGFDEALMDYLKERGVAIEVCLRSNSFTNLVKEVDEHPAKVFHARGIPIIPCSDDHILFQSRTDVEYELLHRSGVSKEQVNAIAKNAHAHAFSATWRSKMGHDRS